MASGQTEYIKQGSTDVTMYVNLVQNTSGPSPGEDLTGLVFNSTGLKAYYTVNNANPLPITLVTTTTTAVHVDGGFVETSAVNTPGEYKFCIPDIVFALGNKVRITISGHAQLLTHVINIVMTAIDLYDAQRMGLVSLPSVGTLAVKPTLAAGVHTGAEIPVTGTVTDGAKDSTVAKDATVMKTTHINATAGKVDSVGAVDSVTGAVGSVTAGVTVTANNDKTGYSLTQAFPPNFSDMAITVTTGQVTVGTNADKSGYSISGTKTTLDALNDVSAADVNAQCDQALLDYDAPTNTEMTAAFTEIKGATFSGATDSLEAIRDRGDAAWTTGAGGTPPDLLQSTTIATLATQTSFTLTAGSADDAAYAGHIAIITDSVTSTQKCVADISTYTGATKTVTLASDPAVFTMAAGDTIDIIAATGAGGSGATAAEVWGYATRALTDKAGFTISGTKTTLDSLNDVAATDIVSAGAITTLAGAVVNVDTVDSVTGSVGSVSGNVDGSVGSLGAQAKLDVNAEADTALSDYGALKPTVAGRTLDVTLTGEAGIDLDNTVGTLAKGTDITGFNDIAATDVVTAGPITTLSGAVVNVDTVDSVTGSVGSVTAGVTVSTNNDKTGYSADVVSISGDTVAADNLEAQYDGSGLVGDTYPATQQQVGSIATGAPSISTVAESDVVTIGTEVNTFAVTDELDGIYHEVSDVGGALDMYYQFDVGAGSIASSVQMSGRLSGANDSIGVYAYDWISLAWDQVGSLQGTNGSTDGTKVFSLLNRHTGTGANDGKVRVRGYAASGLTSSTLYMDQVFISYSVIAPAAVEIRQEIDSNSTQLAKLGTPSVDISADIAAIDGVVSTLSDGVIKANAAGGFHVQMLDAAGDPVASQAVTMTRRLDNGAFASATGTASNTDANGVSYIAYSAADVNGTDAVAFKFSATGAKDTYIFAKLSV